MAWDKDQIANAQIIISVGRQLGASDRDIQIGLMTALQESDLRNINYGDRDSLGLFQQRPSMGWGTREQVTDPYYAARTFFQGKPGNPGLFSIKNRDSLPLTVAAQKVQRSAFPDAYAKHEGAARELMGLPAGGAPNPGAIPPTAAVAPGVGPSGAMATRMQMESPGALNMVGVESAAADSGDQGLHQVGVDKITPEGWGGDGGKDFLPFLDQDKFFESLGGSRLPGIMETPQAPVAATGMRKKVIDYAMGLVGTPYVWGGSSRSGVDCSGLIQLAYSQFGVDLPRISYQQAQYGPQTTMDKAKPGDLVAWDNSSRNSGADHIAIYLGNGQILEVPHPGAQVRIRQLGSDEGNWFVSMDRVAGG